MTMPPSKLVPLLVLLVAGTAVGQPIPEPKRVFGTMTERDDGSETADRLDSAITTRLTIPETTFVPCQASVSLAYYQRNTLARVETTIDNQSCRIGSGTLEINASVRKAGSDRVNVTFPESWEQHDGGKVVFTRDYPIGDNVELLRVRSRGVECTCEVPAGTVEDEPASE